MKKYDLVREIASEIKGVTCKEVSEIVNKLFEKLSKALEVNDSYNHDNFGTFKVVLRKARKGRNPQTEEIINIPARKTVKFVVSGTIKKKLNKK